MNELADKLDELTRKTEAVSAAIRARTERLQRLNERLAVLCRCCADCGYVMQDAGNGGDYVAAACPACSVSPKKSQAF